MLFTPKSLAKAVVNLDEHEREVFNVLVEALDSLRDDEPPPAPQKRKYTRKAKAAAKDPNRPKRKYTRKAKPEEPAFDDKFPKEEKGEEKTDAA